MRHPLLYAFCLVATLWASIASTAEGQSRSWSGALGIEPFWENILNWAPVGAPLTNETVLIGDIVPNAVVDLDSQQSVAGLTMSEDAYLLNIFLMRPL